MNANTSVVVKSTLDDGTFKLRALRLSDALCRPYELELELLTTRFDLDMAELIGREIGVQLKRPDGSKRAFHGLVAAIEAQGATERFGAWRASVRPRLWFLQDAVDSRVFQNKTVPEIVKEGVLKRQGITDIDDRLSGTYDRREYCVQYAESDLDFVHRLMEEEGIYYFFRHEEDKHVLVLCDSPQAHTEEGTVEYRPQSRASVDAQEGLSDWREVHEVAPAAVAVADYDCTKPKVALAATSSLPPGSAQHAEQFEYAAGFADNAAGERRAKIRREALQAGRRRFYGEGNPFELGTGGKFSLARHERLDAAYVVTQATHAIESTEFEHGATDDAPSFRIASTFTAIPADTRYHPPRVTPRPPMRGPQTAVVQGPSGQEIHVDELGRVKLRFFWDRLGAPDDTASCWVRVSQGAAGRHWGHMAIPRVSGCAEGSQRLTVWKDREATVKNGDDRLTLEQGSRTVSIAQDDQLTVRRGDRSVKIEAGKHTVEAAVSITFKVGANSITIDQGGITIKGLQVQVEGETGVKVQGLQVKVEATTALDLAALCTRVDSQALLTMKGALVTIN